MAREKNTPTSHLRTLRSCHHSPSRPRNPIATALSIPTAKPLPPLSEPAKLAIATAIEQAFFSQTFKLPTTRPAQAMAPPTTARPPSITPPTTHARTARTKRPPSTQLITLISTNWTAPLSSLIPSSIYPRLPRKIKIRGPGFYEQRRAPPETWPYELLTYLLEMSRMIPDAEEAVRLLVRVNHGRRRGKIRKPDEVREGEWKRERGLMELGAWDVRFAVGEWVGAKGKGKGKVRGRGRMKGVECEVSDDEDEEVDETEEAQSGPEDEDVLMENDDAAESTLVSPVSFSPPRGATDLNAKERKDEETNEDVDEDVTTDSSSDDAVKDAQRDEMHAGEGLNASETLGRRRDRRF